MSQSVFAILSWSKEGLRLALMCRSRASSGMKISEVSKQLKGQLKLKIMVMIAGPFTTVSCHGINTNWFEGERWTSDDIPWIFRCLFYTCVFDLSQKISSRICLILKNAIFVFCELTVLYFQNYFWPHTISPDYSITTQRTQTFPSFWQTNFVLKFWFKHNLPQTFKHWGEGWLLIRDGKYSDAHVSANFTVSHVNVTQIACEQSVSVLPPLKASIRK